MTAVPEPLGAPAASTTAVGDAGRPAIPVGAGPGRDRRAVDAAGALVLTLIAGAGFLPVVGPARLAVVVTVAALIGVGLGLLWSGRRPLVWLLPATFLTTVVVAPAAVAHPDVVAGVVPGAEALTDATRSVVTSWKDLLTATPPVDDDPAALFAPFLVVVATGLATTLAALRLGRFRIAAAVAVLGLTVAVLLGSRDVVLPAVVGVSVLPAVLGWEMLRARSGGPRTAGSGPSLRPVRPLRVVGGVVMTVVALAAGTVAAPALTDLSHRTLARDRVEPPLDVRQFVSPLVGFRNYRGDLRGSELFTVDRAPEDGRVRLASLDAYDGVVFGSAGGRTGDSGVFEKFSRARNRSGAWADLPQGPRTEIGIDVTGYSGVWVPGPAGVDDVDVTGGRQGRSGSLRENLYFNPAAATMVTTPALTTGDGYIVRGRSSVRPTDAEIGDAPAADLTLPEPQSVPEIVTETAAEVTAGAVTDLEKVRAVEAYLHGRGFYSSGQRGEVRSRAGHNADRIAVLLEGEQMIGDEEQYAVAMALMVRTIGLPARVVVGFALPADAADGPVSVTGDMASAWVEVPFDGIGWVGFAPTPDRDRIPQQLAPEPKTSPKPKSIQPPPPPQQSVELVAASSAGGGDQDRDTLAWLWALLLDILVLLARALLIAALLAMVPVAVVVAKIRRGRARRTAADPRDRVLGGWEEMVDVFVDLGAARRRGATRREIAEHLAGLHPELAVRPLAGGADAGAFAPGVLAAEQADGYWEEVDRVREEVRRSTPPMVWWRSRISLRSFLSEDTARDLRQRSGRFAGSVRTLTAGLRRSDEREWVR